MIGMCPWCGEALHPGRRCSNDDAAPSSSKEQPNAAGQAQVIVPGAQTGCEPAPAAPTEKVQRSILDMTQPDDNLRWALAALDLVANGLRNRRGLAHDDIEMQNLKTCKVSIEAARMLLQTAQSASGALDEAKREIEHWKRMYECAQNANALRSDAIDGLGL